MANADRTSGKPRAWQRMLSGRRLDLLDPSPLDVEIEDIAHGLARVARWNGQTVGEHAFSVAQHSLLVDQIFSMALPALRAGMGRRWVNMLSPSPSIRFWWTRYCAWPCPRCALEWADGG
ncbi:hypothetical protein N509_00661 [Brucella abortus BC95]|nr:hypothetical protein N509_00661 [Brucella abortus BC95]